MGIYKNLDLRDKSNFIKFYALGPMQNSSKPALFNPLNPYEIPVLNSREL